MIADLKPYPEYNRSSADWIGRLPAHWKTRRIKYLLNERNERSEKGHEQLLRVSRLTGITERANLAGDVADTRAESLKGYKLVHANDLVVNIMLAWNGSLGVSRFDLGITSPAYCVYRFRNELCPWYYHHLLRSPTYKSRVKALSTGVVESRLRLYTDDLFCLEGILPPSDEQELIVRFLDWTSVRLEKAIRAKRRVIALLEEQKQAIIHRSVSRGLDDTVSLKPSGLDWLGDVPEHWEMRRAKYLYREIDERSTTGNEELLSVSHITGVTPRSQKNITMFKARSYVGHKVCRPSDLVINTMWAWMAALGVSELTGIVSPAYAVYRPRTSLLTDAFVDRLLRISSYRAEFLARSTGIRLSRMRLYPEQFFRIPLPIPPVPEQEAIVRDIVARTENLDAGIEFANREIELLCEYRTRLISDVVTGKLDVREVARSLPTETEPLDEAPDADFDDFADDELETELAEEVV